MKTIGLLLFALLFSQSLSYYCQVNDPATSKSYCKKSTLGYGIYTCCYVEKKYSIGESNKEENVCYPVKEEEYKDIKSVVSSIEYNIKASDATNVKVNIDCASKYLVASILSLLLFLL